MSFCRDLGEIFRPIWKRPPLYFNAYNWPEPIVLKFAWWPVRCWYCGEDRQFCIPDGHAFFEWYALHPDGKSERVQ